MSKTNSPNHIHSSIWREEPEPDNPYATRMAYCRGYDVYGDMLGKARWVDMLYLLFHENPPSSEQADLLETLAVALANPGPRDASVHAAMCGGICGSVAAASLTAALAVGAGQLAGAREVFRVMHGWNSCGLNLMAWQYYLAEPPSSDGSIWPASSHPPGFDPHGTSTATPVRQTLSALIQVHAGTRLTWLQVNRPALEVMTGLPLAMSAVAAATLTDLDFTPEQGEMLYLLLRLPGAAAHALEQSKHNYTRFPFGAVELCTHAAQETT